jgi:glycosyltransferase involved in cell wall biosynthesis
MARTERWWSVRSRALDTPLGTREIVDESSGILCSPGDIHQLAAAVLRLLADDQLCSSLVANARERVTAEYDVAHVVEQHVQLYKRLC